MFLYHSTVSELTLKHPLIAGPLEHATVPAAGATLDYGLLALEPSAVWILSAPCYAADTLSDPT